MPLVVRALGGRYHVTPEPAAEGLARTRAMLDRIAAEVGPSGYMVGEAFTVADLTAAGLCFPLAPEPYLRPAHLAARPLLDCARSSPHPAVAYVAEMYERHRGTAPRRAPRPAPAALNGARRPSAADAVR